MEIKDYTNDLQKATFAPVIAKTRVHHFWGGVYKCFAIRGSHKYYIHISRNYSFNTMISGIMLQPIITPNGGLKWPIDCMGDVLYPHRLKHLEIPKNPGARAAAALWKTLDDSVESRREIKLDLPLRIYCYRALLPAAGGRNLKRLWRRRLPLWTQSDREECDRYVEEARQWIIKRNPHIWHPDGSRTDRKGGCFMGASPNGYKCDDKSE